MRPTRDGLIVLALSLTALAVGAAGRAEVPVAVGAVGLALLAVSVVDGRDRLRRVLIRRRLSESWFAGRVANGGWDVVAPRRLELALRDPDALGPAVGTAFGEGTWAASWRIDQRGDVSLSDIVLATRSPFGLVEHRRTVDGGDRVVVYPRPLEMGPPKVHAEVGVDEVVGLRTWRRGERVGRIHWRRSLRVGAWWLAERAAAEGHVIVRVPAASGPGLEIELSRASGAILAAGRRGDRVGLALAGRHWPPRAGAAWRRTLWTALARAGTP